jgi:hypothetical protein
MIEKRYFHATFNGMVTHRIPDVHTRADARKAARERAKQETCGDWWIEEERSVITRKRIAR